MVIGSKECRTCCLWGCHCVLGSRTGDILVEVLKARMNRLNEGGVLLHSLDCEIY